MRSFLVHRHYFNIKIPNTDIKAKCALHQRNKRIKALALPSFSFVR